MSEHRLGTSPGLIIGSGIAGTGVFIAVVFFLRELTQSQLVIAASTGAFAAISAGVSALWSTWANRHESEKFATAERDARTDQLTDLLNRVGLWTELDHSIAKARKSDTVLGVLFLDLDRFKVINDSMGHDAGDELLKIVASRLRRAVRSSDVVARFGGDEFVVVCRELLTDASVEAVARQILRAFEEPVSLRGGSQVIGTSIGVTVARPGDVRSGEDLVRDADAAMYKAKKAKSGYAMFDEAQRLQVIDRLDIERDLNKALEEDQLSVVYQPLVDVRTKRLYGFEALVRWMHPTRGEMSPGQFLAVAEEAGMMSRIGELVLREACAQLAVWNHLSPDARDVKISVNVAEQQLLDANFPFLVQDILTWSGLPPEQLVLEIVEDTIVDHLKDGIGRLRDIRDIGVGLAIDDFGTGQSSLSYVKQFDMVSTLKIDKTFVDQIGAGQSDRAIIEAIVAMARALDLRVVAEGVERNDQVKELFGMGVEIMQGYLFNAPVRPDGVDPLRWFKPRTEAAPASGAGLTPLEVSRTLVAPGEHARPPRRG
ncbi:MAG: putative bifunctional diguanylate cyclase/phosphodiesterase [Acidimicrobiales bacterium]